MIKTKWRKVKKLWNKMKKRFLQLISFQMKTKIKNYWMMNCIETSFLMGYMMMQDTRRIKESLVF